MKEGGSNTDDTVSLYTIIRFAVRGGEIAKEALRSAILVYSSVMVTVLAAIVLGRHLTLTPKEMETIGFALQAASVVVLVWPLLVVLVWFFKRYLNYFENELKRVSR